MLQGGGGGLLGRVSAYVASMGELSWWMLAFRNGDDPCPLSTVFPKGVIKFQ